jgi:hypothetical protein
MGLDGQRHATAGLPLGKTKLYRKLGGPQGRSVWTYIASVLFDMQNFANMGEMRKLYKLLLVNLNRGDLMGDINRECP